MIKHLKIFSRSKKAFGAESWYIQGSHRLEKYLKMKGSLEKSLKTKFVLKSPSKLSIDLEKYLNFTFSCILDNFKSL